MTSLERMALVCFAIAVMAALALTACAHRYAADDPSIFARKEFLGHVERANPPRN
jgi:hypothetical protein